jgi:hypothetical protein
MLVLLWRGVMTEHKRRDKLVLQHKKTVGTKGFRHLRHKYRKTVVSRRRQELCSTLHGSAYRIGTLFNQARLLKDDDQTVHSHYMSQYRTLHSYVLHALTRTCSQKKATSLSYGFHRALLDILVGKTPTLEAKTLSIEELTHYPSQLCSRPRQGSRSPNPRDS